MEQRHEVIIIGGGFAGIGAAIKLKESGITDFVLLEKADALGGVWRENTYPGCACDVPSALYSFSFAPNPAWSRVFAGQPEIRQYLEDTANRAGIVPHVRFGHEVLAARWSEPEAVWLLETPRGVLRARHVILAAGPMHEPVMPDIPGLGDFNGAVFHSSRWRHDIDLRGKRVAVIGSGASAIQFVPAIQPDVARLTLFQRTPHWVLPKLDQALPRWIQRIFRDLPLTQLAMRGMVYGVFETLNGGMQNIAAMRQFQRLASLNIRLGIRDPMLRRKVTPDYVIGCKRVLQSSDWYPTLAKPNVDVIASGLHEVRGNTLIASDGSACEADVIILGTGFEIAEPPIARRVFNRDGVSMAEVWNGSPEGFLGTTVAGCPNAFLMFGPNIAVSSSALIIIEAQLAYIVDALRQARQKALRTMEPHPARIAEFNARVQAALADSVWNKGGCTSYFIDRNGRNSTVWPWTTLEMRRQLSRCDLADYLVEPAEFQAQPRATTSI